jgi:hypothetical protein
VGEIYKWLDEQTSADKIRAGVCNVCGKCCDFESFGHRLYITTPEVLYFIDKTGGGHPGLSGKQVTAGRCPRQIEGKCTVYPHRFAGCRIFCCRGDKDFQSYLTEAAIKKFKALCEEFQIPYLYVDLPGAL